MSKSVLIEPFKLEKIVKKSKGKSLVKYLDYPDSFTEWIPNENLNKLLVYYITKFSKKIIYNPTAYYILKYNHNKFLLKCFSICVNQNDFCIVNIINIFYCNPIKFNNESEFNNWKLKCDIKYWQN